MLFVSLNLHLVFVPFSTGPSSSLFRYPRSRLGRVPGRVMAGGHQGRSELAPVRDGTERPGAFDVTGEGRGRRDRRCGHWKGSPD